MEYFANTDVGISRSNNEDSYLVKSYGENKILAIIADGMGGHNAGEKASRMAVDKFCAYIDTNCPDIFELSERKIFINLQKAMSAINTEVYSQSQLNHLLSGMGTTIVACLITETKYYVVNVGDSRMYVLNNSVLNQITKDHSLVAELLDLGVITPEQAREHPKKNVITRAIGSDSSVECDGFSGELNKGDVIILCTDGLTNMVDETEIKNIISENVNLDNASEKLVKKANESGGKDNISLILVRI